jgi:hypothetical protein
MAGTGEVVLSMCRVLGDETILLKDGEASGNRKATRVGMEGKDTVSVVHEGDESDVGDAGGSPEQ